MKTAEAVQILETHNKWRRGVENVEMVDTKLIGEAIDLIVSQFTPSTKEKTGGEVDGISIDFLYDQFRQLPSTNLTDTELEKEAEAILCKRWECKKEDLQLYLTLSPSVSEIVKSMIEFTRKISLPETDKMGELIRLIKDEKAEYNHCKYLTGEQKATLDAYDFVIEKAKKLLL
jgi:hypothetical protein